MKKSLLLTTTLFCTLSMCASSLYAPKPGLGATARAASSARAASIARPKTASARAAFIARPKTASARGPWLTTNALPQALNPGSNEWIWKVKGSPEDAYVLRLNKLEAHQATETETHKRGIPSLLKISDNVVETILQDVPEEKRGFFLAAPLKRIVGISSLKKYISDRKINLKSLLGTSYKQYERILEHGVLCDDHALAMQSEANFVEKIFFLLSDCGEKLEELDDQEKVLRLAFALSEVSDTVSEFASLLRSDPAYFDEAKMETVGKKLENLEEARKQIYRYHRLREGKITESLLLKAFPFGDLTDLLNSDYPLAHILVSEHKAWFTLFLEGKSQEAAATYARDVMSTHPSITSIPNKGLKLLDDTTAYTNIYGVINTFYDAFPSDPKLGERAEKKFPGILERCATSYAWLKGYEEGHILDSVNRFSEAYTQNNQKRQEAIRDLSGRISRDSSSALSIERDLKNHSFFETVYESFQEAVTASKKKNDQQFNTTVKKGQWPQDVEPDAERLMKCLKESELDQLYQTKALFLDALREAKESVWVDHVRLMSKPGVPWLTLLGKIENCARNLLAINDDLATPLYKGGKDIDLITGVSKDQKTWEAFTEGDMNPFKQPAPTMSKTVNTDDWSVTITDEDTDDEDTGWEDFDREKEFALGQVEHVNFDLYQTKQERREERDQRSKDFFNHARERLESEDAGRLFLKNLEDNTLRSSLSLPPLNVSSENVENKAGNNDAPSAESHQSFPPLSSLANIGEPGDSETSEESSSGEESEEDKE